MEEREVIAELLIENFPIECETVGPTNLQDIINAEVEFHHAEHGSFVDLGTAISALVIAVAFIKNVLSIYSILKDELKRRPYKSEIELRLIDREEIIQDLDSETRAYLLKEIFLKINVEK